MIKIHYFRILLTLLRENSIARGMIFDPVKYLKEVEHVTVVWLTDLLIEIDDHVILLHFWSTWPSGPDGFRKSHPVRFILLVHLNWYVSWTSFHWQVLSAKRVWDRHLNRSRIYVRKLPLTNCSTFLQVDSIQREKMVDQSCICLPIPTCDDNSLSGPEIIPPCTTIMTGAN